MKTINFLAVAAIALIGCGDNKTAPDARIRDGQMVDAGFPAAPTLGMQVDRMGRAAVNTALNHGFNGTATAQPAKVAYNQNADKATWGAAANIGEFMSNLAIIDVLDSGICGNGRCETGETGVNCPMSAGGDCGTGVTGAGNGCGNQALYNNGLSPTPMAASYGALATILADDELYLDASKTTCTFYLGVEFGVVTGGGNSTCGGRAPQYDVIDFSFSMLAMGLRGFMPGTFAPLVKDEVGPHTDYLTDFPYLGPPH